MHAVRKLRTVLALVVAATLLAGCSNQGGTASSPAPSPSGASSTASAANGSASPTVGRFPDPLPVTGDIDGVHDPSMVRAPDGTYLLYSTGNYLEIRTSRDRLHFALQGSVWPKGAPWTQPFTSPTDRSALWAPDISYHSAPGGQGSLFYLYYAASSFGSRNSAIFLATSKTGLPGSFTNRGKVWQTTESDDYNAIDPNLLVDSSGWWLTFGSFWSGIKMVRLDPRTGKPDAAHKKLWSLATRSRSVEGAIEAPYVVRHDQYYYLFSAFDFCCRGLSSTYRTMVGRSTSVTGPYLDRQGRKLIDGGGTEVMASHGTIVGPGHPAVLHDGADWLLIYHYYFSDATPATGRLAINRLAWVGGWPVAR